MKSEPMHKMILLICIALLAVLYAATESARYGDGQDYAYEIINGNVIEPGHLLWRPLGAMVTKVTGLNGSKSSVLWVLQFMSLMAALATATTLFLVARRLFPPAISLLVAAFAGLANGFWTYAFSGCSYAMSVLFLVLAMFFILRRNVGADLSSRDIFLAGICGGLAATTWAIQAIAGPALLVLALLADRSSLSGPLALKRTMLLGIGYGVTFFLPLIVCYSLGSSVSEANYISPGPAGLSFLGWLSSSNHGIDGKTGFAQLFRVGLGWPQSIVSVGDLGKELRLWLYGDVAFPASLAVGTLASFYMASAFATFTVVRFFASLDATRRAVVFAALVATAGNLAFGFHWQGTDLERYLPSLPFQALAFGLVVERWHGRAPRVALATSGLMILAAVTTSWFLNFHEVLRPDSLRQTWNRALTAKFTVADVIVVMGNKKFGLGDPHNPNFPRVINVSDMVIMQGDGWRRSVEEGIAKARSRGGHLLIGDSVLRTDNGPRDGWSFVENPRPSAVEIAEFFSPLKSEQVAIKIMGENLWLSKAL